MTAELSQSLFTATLVLYSAAMLAYLYAMAFSVVGVDGDERRTKGRRARFVGTVVAVTGVLTHAGHIVVRSIVAERLPLGNMFEFSSIMALTVVVGGLLVIQHRMKRPELMGFVLLGTVLTLGLSVIVYSDPAPLLPILTTKWRAIHVTTIALSAGIFSLAAVFNALHLLRDTAERRVAATAGDAFGAGTVGAAQAPTDTDPGHDEVLDSVLARVEADVVAGDDEDEIDHDAAYRAALRDVLSQRLLGVRYPWRIAIGSGLVGMVFSTMFFVYERSPEATVHNVRMAATMGLSLVVLTGIAWWAVPYLPSATTLDGLTYRTIAFAFPIWTFAVITGAMWAEQSWGRYWGWDPKETSAFLTWIAYAGYLHARATRGMNGRRAAWLGLGSYGVLLFTYYAVNLLISGLHNYGGLEV